MTTAATPPSVTINSPTNGATITGRGSVNIAISASDASGIAALTISVDSKTLAKCTSVTFCSATWPNNKITNGTHVIGGIAFDTKGLNANASTTVTVLR